MREFKHFSDDDTDDEDLVSSIPGPLQVEESSGDSSDSVSVSIDDNDWKLSDEEPEPGSSEASPDCASDDDDEDAVVKAITSAKQRTNTRPPDITFKNYITDLSFHPDQELLAVSSITGDVFIYNYSLESCDLLETLELHSKSCRNVEFSPNGQTLVSCGKEKSIMVTDTSTNKLKQFYDNAHDTPPYSLFMLNETNFSTGDEAGVLKVWDLRQKNSICSFKTGEEQISSIISNDDARYLVCSASDCLSTYDFNSRKLFVQSETYETELTSLSLLKRGTKLVVGTLNGTLYIFNWGQFGYHSDVYPGPKHAINAGLAITENILVTGCDDGQIMGVNLFPHKQLGVVGQHNMSVEAIDITHDGEFVASASLDETVKFWEIRYFENVHVKPEKAKKTDAQNNLPSSQIANPGQFFAQLN